MLLFGAQLELVESPDEATKSKLEGLQKQVAEMKGQQEEFEVKEAELAAFEKVPACASHVSPVPHLSPARVWRGQARRDASDAHTANVAPTPAGSPQVARG